MGLFGRKKKQVAQQQMPLPKAYVFEVAGLKYYQDRMLNVLEENPNYKNPKSTAKPVYKYRYFDKPCDLVPEPNNEYDPNAILVGYKGRKLGHVPAAETGTVRMLLANGYTPQLHIVHGHYKVYEEDEWVTYKKEPYAKVTLTRP